MIISKEWFIFLGSVLLSASSLFAERIETHLSTSQIQPGSRAVLDLKLISEAKESDQNLESEVYVMDDLLLEHKQLKVLDKKFIREDNVPMFRYEITAYDLGEIRIPPIQVKWGANQLSTESTPLQVVTTLAPEDQTIREAFDEVSRPIPYLRIARLFLIAVITYFICWILWPWMQKIPGLIPNPKRLLPAVKEEDPFLWLKRELTRFKAKVLKETDNPKLIDEWYQIIKTFFTKTEKTTVNSWTTQEFKTRLKANSQAIQITPHFETCDTYKFSEQKNISIVDTVDHWIQETEKTLLCGK